MKPDRSKLINVLLITEHCDSTHLISNILQGTPGTQFHLESVGTLSDGVDLISNDSFDVVLLDPAISDSSCSDRLDALNAQTLSVPVIVLLESDDETLWLDAERHGAEDYLVKGKMNADALSRSIRYAITRKPIEKALHASESRYSELADMLPQIIWEIDTQGTVLYANTNALSMLGYEKSDLERGLNALDTLIPEDRARARANLMNVMNGGTSVGNEYTALKTDGSTFPVVIHSAPIMRDGKPIGLRGMTVDVSQSKESENALRESKRMLSTLLANLPGISYRCSNDIYWTMTYISEGCLDLTGYLPRDIIGNRKLSYSDIIHPDDRARVWTEIQESLEQSRPFQIEYRIYTADGTEKWVWEQGRGVYSENEEIIALEGLINDITARRQVEADLNTRLNYERALSDVSEMAVGVKDVCDFQYRCLQIVGEAMNANRGYVLVYNSATQTVTNTAEWVASGFEPQRDRIVNLPLNLHPYLMECMINNHVMNCADVKMIPSTSEREILLALDVKSVMGLPLYIGETLYGFLGFDDCTNYGLWPDEDVEVLRTITRIIAGVIERKKTEDAQRQIYHTLQKLIEAAPLAIISIDLNENVQVWNPAAERMFGWTAEEIVGHRLPIVPSHKRDEFLMMVQRLSEEEIITDMDVRRMKKDGSEIDVNTSITLQRTTNGEITGYMATIADLPERRQLEAQLRQAQRLETVGRLAGGIAHDFRNLLMGISGYAEILQIKLGKDNPHNPCLEDLLSCVDRASKITGQLLTFSRNQFIDPRPVSLNQLISDSMPLVEQFLGEHISVKWEPSPDSGTIEMDPGQIEQVLINLAINARDAMPTGGQLSVNTNQRHLDRKDAIGAPWVKPGDYTELTVSDTGIGMDRSIQEHIFEPFFTTKNQAEHSGLGLSIVYGIVKQHCGYISVESSIGHGTTFKVCLPLIKMQPESNTESQSTISEGGRETILLAEDEDAVRTPIKLALEGYGYKVLCASDGDEAIDLFNTYTGNIDFAILDIIMPKSGGKYVWNVLHAHNPDLKALFISGYTADSVHEDFAPPEDLPILVKPFSLVELMHKVRELLSESSGQ